MSLTPKQARFVEEYLIDLNATQAAIRASYSAKTAEVQGSRLLGNVKVREAVEAGMKDPMWIPTPLRVYCHIDHCVDAL